MNPIKQVMNEITKIPVGQKSHIDNNPLLKNNTYGFPQGMENFFNRNYNNQLIFK